MKKIGLVVLGATGFGGGEMLRIISNHPDIEFVSAISESQGGKAISFAHPQLTRIYEGTFETEIDWKRLLSFDVSCIVSALPHGESAKKIKSLLDKCPSNKVVFIDLSGDLRIKDSQTHHSYYPNTPFLDELRDNCAYGLPELFGKSIAKSNIISNPGCLATATILALAPLAASFGINSNPICNLATGSSGAGKEPKSSTHHPVRHSNFFAYKALSHQHTPEIEQALSMVCEKNVEISFVPHSLPTSRGIFATIYCEVSKVISEENLYKCYESFYSNAPFVRLFRESPVELENVIGTNFCDLSVQSDGKLVVVNAAIDNLIKGMVGQAIQNLNLRAGIKETTGLWFGGLRPI